jgi:Na+/melibiose symporter-like transporter
MKLELWQKLCLLFTVIWVVVSALNAATIYAFAEGLERGKVWRPVILGVAVPVAVYLLAWGWSFLRKRKTQAPK